MSQEETDRCGCMYVCMYVKCEDPRTCDRMYICICVSLWVLRNTQKGMYACIYGHMYMYMCA